MVLGPVNETLSRQFSVADDGLSDAERSAYDHCRPLSCKHEACYKRYMYVQCLALLPDGLRFVSGSADNTARITYHGLAPLQ